MAENDGVELAKNKGHHDPSDSVLEDSSDAANQDQRILEPLTVSQDSFRFILEKVDQLLDALLEFKVRPPFSVPPTEIGQDSILSAVKISDDGEPLDSILETLSETILPSSLNFGAPSFLAHPDCGNSIAAILGDFARSFLQQNLSSFDYSPAASLLELQLLKLVRRRVGFPSDPEAQGTLSAGGAFVFGGAGANFSCLLAARESLKHSLYRQGVRYDPRRTRVLANRPFTHFSLRRSLYMLGLGNADLSQEEREAEGLDKECLKEVDTREFRLDPADLERVIEETLARDEHIMAVFTTAGDSRMMAFDPLKEVLQITERHGLWLHVDACEGGQVLFSPARRSLMEGVERADSIAMDPHKVLMIPYNLSLYLLREPSNLVHTSGGSANVIVQDDRTLGMYTPAINSKGFISIKLWFLLKHWGWERLAREIDHRHELALHAAEEVRRRTEFVLVNPCVEHNAVAFMFCPPEYRAEVTLDKINELNRELHEKLNMTSSFFVHSFPSRDDAGVLSSEHATIYPLRMMFGNPLTTRDIVGECLNKISELGTALVAGK